MNWTRVAPVGAVGACAWAAWSWRPVIDNHGSMRALIIVSTLARFDDAIVVLGDSIVEASTLPRTLCGRAIVNAGIGGSSGRRSEPADFIDPVGVSFTVRNVRERDG